MVTRTTYVRVIKRYFLRQALKRPCISTHRAHRGENDRLLHTQSLVRGVELDNELGVLGALLGDALEEDVGVNTPGARGDADYGSPGAIMAFKQSGK